MSSLPTLTNSYPGDWSLQSIYLSGYPIQHPLLRRYTAARMQLGTTAYKSAATGIYLLLVERSIAAWIKCFAQGQTSQHTGRALNQDHWTRFWPYHHTNSLLHVWHGNYRRKTPVIFRVCGTLWFVVTDSKKYNVAPGFYHWNHSPMNNGHMIMVNSSCVRVLKAILQGLLSQCPFNFTALMLVFYTSRTHMVLVL